VVPVWDFWLPANAEPVRDSPAAVVTVCGIQELGKHDQGTSWYHIDEHLETFQFQQGWNRILVRLENGGGAAAGFSFLICPKDAAIAANTQKAN
jgi:hypothetical protein